MQIKNIIISPAYSHNIPIIDMEFDKLELSNDLAANMREAATSTFYHGILALAE